VLLYYLSKLGCVETKSNVREINLCTERIINTRELYKIIREREREREERERERKREKEGDRGKQRERERKA